MELSNLWEGGGYRFNTGQEFVGDLPIFTFVVKDLERVRELLHGMYVELDVRFNTQLQLAYHLSVPDRQHSPWNIPLDPEDIPRIERGERVFNSCPTIIADPQGNTIDLQSFVLDLTHDWSGTYASAHLAFMSNRVEEAINLLVPLLAGISGKVPAAHHLLGRCYRSRGDLKKAIRCYYNTIRNARDTMGIKMLPVAAGVLSDMGVAFKKLGESARAIHCLLHSLHLRPNHPEALATFVSLFPQHQRLVTYGIARIIAIGGRDSLVREVAIGYGQAMGINPKALLIVAQDWSKDIDLRKWPFANKEFATYDRFRAGFEYTKQAAVLSASDLKKIP